MLQIYHSAKEKIDFPQVSTSQPLRNITVLGFTDKAFKLYRFQAGHHFQIKLWKKLKLRWQKEQDIPRIYTAPERILHLVDWCVTSILLSQAYGTLLICAIIEVQKTVGIILESTTFSPVIWKCCNIILLMPLISILSYSLVLKTNIFLDP